MRAVHLLFIVTFATFAAACSPLSQFRQSARVGHTAPPPWVGAAAHKGEVWAGVGVEGGTGLALSRERAVVDDFGLLPDKGDPGLFISPVRGFVQVRGGVSDALELGMRAYADEPVSATPTRLGVLSIPNRRASWGVGPTLSASGKLGHGFALVARAEGMLNLVPYAKYRLKDDAPHAHFVEGDGNEFYVLRDVGMARRMRWSGSFAMSWRDAGDRGDAYLGVVLADQLTNDGFSESGADPVVHGNPALLLATGGALQVEQLRVGGQVWARVTDSNDYGSAMPRLGAQVLVEGRLHATRPSNP